MACALCGGASDDRSPAGRVSATRAGQTAGLHAGGSHGQVRRERLVAVLTASVAFC